MIYSIMGCAISGHRRVIDSNLLHLNENSSVELISSSLQLINYFKNRDSNLPKCIFIFGGSGSNKGEFIYEMICASWVNYNNEQLYECQQEECQKQKLTKEQVDSDYSGLRNVSNNDLRVETIHQPHQTRMTNSPIEMTNDYQDLKSDHSVPHIAVNNHSQNAIHLADYRKYSIGEHTGHRLWNSNTQLSTRSSFSNISLKYQDNLNFVYSYIDIERLILDNLKERIKNVGECGNVGYDELFDSETSLIETKFSKEINLNDDKETSSTVQCDLNGNKNIGNEKIGDQNQEKVNKNVDNVIGGKIDNVQIANLIDVNHRDCFEKNHIDNHTNCQTNNQMKTQINNQVNVNNLHENEHKNNSTDKVEEIEHQKNKQLDQTFKSDFQQNDKKMQKEFYHHHNESIAVKIDNHKANQTVHLSKKNSRRSRQSIKNSDWSEFLKACEEDFEFNQSKINTNYNSRDLKQCMFTYANCVTNNWVFSLIEKEIEKRNQSLKERFIKLVEIHHSKSNEEHVENGVLNEESNNENGDDVDQVNKEIFHKKMNRLNRQQNTEYVLPEVIYIVNLIPNQINIFRHCLFLQQTPNLGNFNVNFIAINLISGDTRKKDLDSVISHSIQEELNFNYMNYFRSIDRLTDVQIRQLKQKIRIRINKSKHAIKMNTESDVQLLLGALTDNQEIDLSGFKVQSERKKSSQIKSAVTESEKEKGNLLYIIDDVVDIGDVLFCIEDRTLKMSTLRKFIQVYLKHKDKISFNRLYC